MGGWCKTAGQTVQCNPSWKGLQCGCAPPPPPPPKK